MHIGSGRDEAELQTVVEGVKDSSDMIENEKDGEREREEIGR